MELEGTRRGQKRLKGTERGQNGHEETRKGQKGPEGTRKGQKTTKSARRCPMGPEGVRRDHRARRDQREPEEARKGQKGQKVTQLVCPTCIGSEKFTTVRLFKIRYTKRFSQIKITNICNSRQSPHVAVSTSESEAKQIIQFVSFSEVTKSFSIEKYRNLQSIIRLMITNADITNFNGI